MSASNQGQGSGNRGNFNLWLLLAPAIGLTFVFGAFWLWSLVSDPGPEPAATAEVSSRSDANDTISARTETMRRNATCNQPAAEDVDVPYGGPDGQRRSRWVNVWGGCIADPTPGIGSGEYRVWCKDMEWNEHEWSDEACWYYRALAFQRTGSPALGEEDETLSLDIPFRPIIP